MQSITNSQLFQEIHQQPEIIQNLITHSQNSIKALVEEIHSREIRHIYIAARGTSDNAGRYAQYLLGAHNQMVVSLATSSLFTIYNQPPNLSDSLVLGISQSGKSPDIVSVVAEGKKQGALTAAITNNPHSDLGKAAEFILNLQAGDELSLAATKTYTAQLTTLAILSAMLDGAQQYQQDLRALPSKIERIFDDETHVKNLAERYRYMSHCVIIARGFNYASAFEFSLKMKELTYTLAIPYSSADFLHGPVALVDRGFPVFVIAPDGKMVHEAQLLIDKVRQRHAEVIMFSNQYSLLEMADQPITLPTGLPEWLSPIPAIVPAQLFAMYLAHTRDFDVDNPRGLNKVTETW